MVARMLSVSVTCFALFIGTAHADMKDDCTQGYEGGTDWERQIGGCTAVIRSGEYSGKDLAWAYYNRGIAHLELGENQPAFDNANLALNLDPSDGDTYALRGNARKDLGDGDGAFIDWDRAMELGDEDWVRQWQTYLRDMGHYGGSVDGVYSYATREALRACSKQPRC